MSLRTRHTSSSACAGGAWSCYAMVLIPMRCWMDRSRRGRRHIRSGRGTARVERLRYGLTLLRRRHDRIQTHWSRYSREWSESNLWDSWFSHADGRSHCSDVGSVPGC